MELLSHNASSPDPLHQEVIYKRPFAFQKMESLIKEMQDPEHGVPVRSQKLFLTSIPAAFAGYDIIEWLMERLNIEDSGEAIHLANLLCQHGYFFPVGDNRNLTVKDDSSLYRFQTPYYWPSQVPCLDSVDYAIYLAKRTLRNKQKHGLEDYEIEALGTLRKTLAQKWDFISMQSDEQVRLGKDRKKVDKMVIDSQERAFWRVMRPPPGTSSCVETPPMHMADFHATEGVKQIRRTNIIEDLQAEVHLLRTSCLRSRTKVSQALESLASHSDAYNEHDAFLVVRQPSNPWVSEDTCFWIINAALIEVPTERRVKKWAISMEDLVFDPTGLREFTAYLKKEYCHENIRFWLAVRDMRYGLISQLRNKASEIYNEFLSPGAPCEINIDGRTMDAVQKEMNYSSPSRFTFDPAADHVYTMLLKKDCYPRFIRSEHYKNLLANALQPNTKKRFFNFAAPGKKKSSATTPLIFPIASQSATAGIGEVVRAADEVILITTGNKTDFSGCGQDAEKLSALGDVPYRGDMIPDVKRESDRYEKALSQTSVDDVCPWESMEKLPEKESSKHETPKQLPPSSLASKSHPIPSTSTASLPFSQLIASTCQASIPVVSQPIPGPSHQVYTGGSQPVPSTSSQQQQQPHSSQSPPKSIPSTSQTVIPTSAMLPTSQSIPPANTNTPTTTTQASILSQTPPKASSAGTSGRSTSIESSSSSRPMSKQVSVVSNSASIGGTTKKESEDEEESQLRKSQQSLAESNPVVLPIVVTSPPTASTTTTVTAGSPADQNQNVSLVLTSVEAKHEVESLVEVCPWDHENGTQPETTTFVKTYSTLGYL